MSIINQPRESNLGQCLINNLSIEGEESFDRFYMVVAYAKSSGLSRLSQSLERFRKNGGKIISIIGVDQKNTSIQGLRLIIQNSDESYVYHNENFAFTFHPKLYVFEKENNKAIVYIGSSNLTSGGLFTNYEVDIELKYNLKVDSDREDFNKIKDLINAYSDTNTDFCKVLDEEFLNRLAGMRYLGNDRVQTSIVESMRTPRESIFGRETFRAPAIPLPSAEPGIPPEQIQTTRQGFWKVLSPNDVSLTSSPGQIIIPIRYLSEFPPFSNWTDTPSGARQAEVYFNVIFIDEKDRMRIDEARAIHYIPASHHPRPNQELRFTFRQREVLNRLSEGDIIEFKRAVSEDVWFIIRKLSHGLTEYNQYMKTGKKFGNL